MALVLTAESFVLRGVSPPVVRLSATEAWEVNLGEETNGKSAEEVAYESTWKAGVLREAAQQTTTSSPLGAMSASSDEDYEEWISKQLRLNRVQSCSTTVKENVADKLSTLELEGVNEMLRQLVRTSTGVRDRAQTSLLSSVPAWHQLLPVARSFEKRCVFREPTRRQLARFGKTRAPGTPRWIVERERRWFGPLLTSCAVYEGRAVNLETVSLRRLKWGGTRINFFGFLSIPLLARTRRKNKFLSVLYVDADMVVAVERPGDVLVFASPLLNARAKRPPFRLLRASMADAAKRRAASSSQGDGKDDEGAFGIGDLAWAVDTAMDVDDDEMQTFLDTPDSVKKGVSVQDMLDNNLPAPPPRGAGSKKKNNNNNSDDEDNA